MNPSCAETTQRFLALLDTLELPSLGPTPRASRWPLVTLNSHIDKLCNDAKLPIGTQQLIRAVTLLWHDYLDESHSLSQDISTADGSLIHGIMHRREPDYANAKYWFQRAGTHAAFPSIGNDVQTLLQTSVNVNFIPRLFKSGRWSPNGFVDLCEEFASDPLTPEYNLLQQIQRIETQALLQDFCRNPR
ncbi:MAG: uncharacterized protein JWM68_2250 [Verrucomicrobiales bacterium]|nr:uncharacterized protein [Verrucomicrobiales bacterium]